MSFVLIIIGFLYLFNPNFNIIDIVPDFIGFLLIGLGLGKISHLSENVDLSRKYAYTLAGVEFLKAISLGLISSNDKTWYLLLAFSFGVVECILFILFAKEMFLGIERLGVRYDADYVLSSYGKGKRRRDVITRTYNTVVSFFIARTVFAVIPEFTSLNTDDINRDYTGLRAFLYLIGTVVVLVWSVFFIIRIVSFFNGIRRDTKFITALNKSYADFEAGNTGYRRSAKMKFVILLFTLSALTVLNFNEDGLSMILIAVPSLILTAASCMLLKDNKKAAVPAIIGIPLAALSIFNFTLKQKFYYNDVVRFNDIFHFDASMERFAPVSNIMLAEYILLIVQFTFFVYVLNRAIMKDLSTKCFYLSSSNEANSTLKSELQEYLKPLLKANFVLTVATLALNTVNVKLAVLLGYFSLDVPYGETDFYMLAYHGSVIIATLLTIAWLYVIVKLYRFAKEYVYTSEHIYGSSSEE